MSLLQNKSVLIVGLGLIGGSVARGLRRGGLCRAIYACGRDQRPLQQAQADGVLDEWSTDLKAMAEAFFDSVEVGTPVSILP